MAGPEAQAGSSAALPPAFPWPALGQGQAAGPQPNRHRPGCLFSSPLRQGCQRKPQGFPTEARPPQLSLESRRAQPGEGGPGFLLSPPRRCPPGGCTTAASQVQVNVTFPQRPNWQLGIVRRDEEDTEPRTRLH